jgi:hypothetical protein
VIAMLQQVLIRLDEARIWAAKAQNIHLCTGLRVACGDGSSITASCIALQESLHILITNTASI